MQTWDLQRDTPRGATPGRYTRGVFEITGPVADPLEVVEALIAQEQAVTAVVEQVSTAVVARAEVAAEAMAATPVVAEAVAGAQVGIVAVAVAGQVAAAVVVADEPAVVQALAVAALAEPAVAGVERDVSQAGPDELGAGRAGCRAAQVGFPVGWAASLVG